MPDNKRLMFADGGWPASLMVLFLLRESAFAGEKLLDTPTAEALEPLNLLRLPVLFARLAGSLALCFSGLRGLLCGSLRQAVQRNIVG